MATFRVLSKTHRQADWWSAVGRSFSIDLWRGDVTCTVWGDDVKPLESFEEPNYYRPNTSFVPSVFSVQNDNILAVKRMLWTVEVLIDSWVSTTSARSLWCWYIQCAWPRFVLSRQDTSPRNHCLHTELRTLISMSLGGLSLGWTSFCLRDFVGLNETGILWLLTILRSLSVGETDSYGMVRFLRYAGLSLSFWLRDEVSVDWSGVWASALCVRSNPDNHF